MNTVFETYLKEAIGEDNARIALDALSGPASVSVRMNPGKVNTDNSVTQAFTGLMANFPSEICQKVSPVAWSPYGVFLPERPCFTLDPLLHAGCYYVQDSSAMFVGHVFREVLRSMLESGRIGSGRPVRVLDLCAAPGGKTTDILASLKMSGCQSYVLVSNEIMKQRAAVLADNAGIWGDPHVIVTSVDPKAFASLQGYFDIIVADVPCSGEGMFRKDAGAIAEWSRQNVENCYRLQREIIEDIWPCLRPGGILVYSTCTFNEQENEDNIAWIRGLGADVLDIDISEEWNITGALKGEDSLYRFIPGRSRSEGLCMAVLRKSDDTVLAERRAKDSGKPAKTRPRTDVGAWINGSDHFTLCERGDTLSAIPTWWLAQYRAAEKSLHLLHAGITLGTVKGKDVVPHQSLAISTALNRSAFAQAEVGYGQAIAYLRKEAITLDAATPHGIVLITYHGIPLGFAKNLGNRANNLYPKPWRVLSTHIPTTPPEVL